MARDAYKAIMIAGDEGKQERGPPPGPFTESPNRSRKAKSHRPIPLTNAKFTLDTMACGW